MIACMGGWCAARGHCAHYHAASKKSAPVERLCPKEQDEPEEMRAGKKIFWGGVDNPLLPSQIAENVGDHLIRLFPTAAPARQPADALNPAGVPPLPKKSGENQCEPDREAA